MVQIRRLLLDGCPRQVIDIKAVVSFQFSLLTYCTCASQRRLRIAVIWRVGRISAVRQSSRPLLQGVVAVGQIGYRHTVVPGISRENGHPSYVGRENGSSDIRSLDHHVQLRQELCPSPSVCCPSPASSPRQLDPAARSNSPVSIPSFRDVLSLCRIRLFFVWLSSSLQSEFGDLHREVETRTYNSRS